MSERPKKCFWFRLMGKQGIVGEALRMRSLPASQISCHWWGNHWGNPAKSAHYLQPSMITMGNGLTALLVQFVENTGKLDWKSNIDHSTVLRPNYQLQQRLILILDPIRYESKCDLVPCNQLFMSCSLQLFCGEKRVLEILRVLTFHSQKKGSSVMTWLNFGFYA